MLHQVCHLSYPCSHASDHANRNNESTEILQMLNSAFGDLAAQAEVDLYPAEHAEELQELNKLVYNDINNGVYRAGFARQQAAYDAAVSAVFAALAHVEERL